MEGEIGCPEGAEMTVDSRMRSTERLQDSTKRRRKVYRQHGKYFGKLYTTEHLLTDGKISLPLTCSEGKGPLPKDKTTLVPLAPLSRHILRIQHTLRHERVTCRAV